MQYENLLAKERIASLNDVPLHRVMAEVEFKRDVPIDPTPNHYGATIKTHNPDFIGEESEEDDDDNNLDSDAVVWWSRKKKIFGWDEVFIYYSVNLI